MARARGCDHRGVLAGAMICWAVAAGTAVAQDGAEVTEDLGNSYALARRTTAQGSVIETLLFAGQAIVTELAVPARDAGLGAATTGVVTPAGRANQRADTASLPAGMGAGFGGTWLTGEVISGYLVLHRLRAGEPVTHEIFQEGRKVGVVTELPSTGIARPAARNSFAFESSGDRFVVHLTQPDGTRIQSTSEAGRFLGQAIERTAAVGGAGRSAALPSEPALRPALGAIRPLAPTPEPQPLARPAEPGRPIAVEEPVPQIVSTLPEAVPLPRPSPVLRLQRAPGVQPLRTAAPAPAGNLRRGAAEPTAVVAPDIRPRPAVTSVDVPPRAATKPLASAAAAREGRLKPAGSALAAQPTGGNAKPSASNAAAPATRPKPIVTTENAKAASGSAGKPVAKPRPPTSGASVQ